MVTRSSPLQHALTTLHPTEHSLELERDEASSLVPSVRLSPAERPRFFGLSKCDEGIVFFRPVDGNLSHYTFLGTGLHRDFDFLAQIFVVMHCEKVRGEIQRVVLGPVSGEPITMKLSPMAFDVLSRKLKVWKSVSGGCGYQLSQEMLLGLFQVDLRTWTWFWPDYYDILLLITILLYYNYCYNDTIYYLLFKSI